MSSASTWGAEETVGINTTGNTTSYIEIGFTEFCSANSAKLFCDSIVATDSMQFRIIGFKNPYSIENTYTNYFIGSTFTSDGVSQIDVSSGNVQFT
jgi:hypothetical protein